MAKAIINGYKVLALFSDMTGNGTADWIIGGNESLTHPWVVACVHRPNWERENPTWHWVRYYATSDEARTAWLARVQQYVPHHMSADPAFFAV